MYRITFVGNHTVGKTCLLLTLVGHSFPHDYIPTCVCYDGMYEAQATEDFDRLRPFSYNGADVFLVCFSLVDPDSFEAVANKWIPEILQHTKMDKPIILVGTKLDLRNDEWTLERLRQKRKTPIDRHQGLLLANHIGASEYIEVSAKTGARIRELFDLSQSIPEEGAKREHERTKSTRKAWKDCVLM
ncbi:P-loop containing nucleoside triphosphate hydrolase protein [Flagelloscypha sp. PMI_526]|nr:P-loop containing nucleoside triphosphate hydrolase protein [Flagelloscypha sp. PMI_526]